MKKHSLALTILLTIFVASSLTCTFSEEALPKNYAVIQFGTYEQDGNLINGTEPIEWYVLDIRDGRALLISKYVLDWQYYDKNSIETLWSQSFLKKWLFDEFYMNAFSDAERVIIKPKITFFIPNLRKMLITSVKISVENIFHELFQAAR